MGGFQFAKKIADVLARVDFIVFAALDHRVHEGVVRRRVLASDIAGIAEVHLEFPYALLADIVRHLDISAFKYTFHRWPFGPCIPHGFFQQLTTFGIIRQSIVVKSILYLSPQVGSAARLEPGNISFSACHVPLLEAVFLCEGHPYSVYEPHRLIVVLFQCVNKQTSNVNETSTLLLDSSMRRTFQFRQFLVYHVKHLIAAISVSCVEPDELLKVRFDGFCATTAFLVEQPGEFQNLGRDAPELLFPIDPVAVGILASYQTGSLVYRPVTCCKHCPFPIFLHLAAHILNGSVDIVSESRFRHP